MKNISIALNVLLLAAVAYLYFLHFSANKTPDTSGQAKASAKPSTEALKIPVIVYINEDSLLEKYEYFQVKKKELSAREKQADASLKAKGKALEKEFMSVQERIQKGLLAPNQIAGEEQRLAQKQQAIMIEQERVTKELMDKTQKINLDLRDKVKGLLDSLQATKKYDYILSYGGMASSVLMVNDSLDITSEVLQILNQKPASKD